eukprot:1745751-Prymnesium_polylepis.1
MTAAPAERGWPRNYRCAPGSPHRVCPVRRLRVPVSRSQSLPHLAFTDYSCIAVAFQLKP